MTEHDSTVNRESSADSSNDRAALHVRLDKLLDRRERIEAHTAGCYARNVAPMPPPGRISDYNPRDAYSACLTLARDVAGPMLPWLAFPSFPEYQPGPAQLLALQDRLNLALSLLEPSGKRPVVRGKRARAMVLGRRWRDWRLGAPPLDVATIRTELLALAHGDTSDLFAPAIQRVAGQQAKRHQLARARLRALENDRFRHWENARRPENERECPAAWRSAIIAAFGASDWDTVRKWKALCRGTLGSAAVEMYLVAAEMGCPEWEDDPTLDEWLVVPKRPRQRKSTPGRIKKDGARYLVLQRASSGAERVKRKSRKARLKQDDSATRKT
jgi:hypothetical protein